MTNQDDIRASLPNFNGKVVLVYHVGSRDPQISSVVVNPEFEFQGGRLFLCGEPAPGDTPNDWITGCRLCLAWDTVEAYVVFESIADHQVRCERGRSTEGIH